MTNILKYMASWTELTFLLKLLSFTGLTLVVVVGYRDEGFSATWLLLGLINLSILMSMLRQLKHQQRQMKLVLRALVNGDNSMGLRQPKEIASQLEDINQRMQAARFEAEQQAHFLQMIMLHVEVAVLVFDETGQVIESNPAVSRLLGKSITSDKDLGSLRSLLVDCDVSMSKIVGWQHNGQQDTLSIKINCVVIGGKPLKIICLQSIREALQNNELAAYKQLTKVLTHEVANSITPLVSLADGCHRLLPSSLTFTDAEDKEDLALGLSTLSKRTEFLASFIERFRLMSDIPAPNLQSHSVSELVHRIYQLHYHGCTQAHIHLTVDVTPSPLVMIDSSQIEQVLINLVKNAIDSVSMRLRREDTGYQGQIILRGAMSASGNYAVDVCDNGMGISEEVSEMMFVPFFTTKQKGSGIGLSLSKQIMKEHGGDLLTINTESETIFRCIFC